MKLFILRPEIVFQARVNQSVFSYPISSVIFDTVTIGTYTDIDVGMTVFFSSSLDLINKGSQRIRTAASPTSINIGRSSLGSRPGEVSLDDNDYITIVDLREIWSRPPFILSENIVQKDPGVDVEWRTTNPPPVCNVGSGRVATIDSITGEAIFSFPQTGSFSYATSTGVTIISYLWDIKDGTIVSGAVNTENITLSFPAGFRYISLTITDSEGHFSSRYIPIVVEDPANSLMIPFEIVSHRITDEGQTISIKPLIDLPFPDYPPGTLAMIWDGEPSGPGDVSNVIFSGWMGDIPMRFGSVPEGSTQEMTIDLRDIAGKLNLIHAFSQAVEDDSIRDTDQYPEITWFHMVNLTIDRYVYYLLRWHSTALALTDFYWSNTGTNYAATTLHSDGQTFWDQCRQRVRQMIPPHKLTCDRYNVLRMLPDPMTQELVDRTSTVQKNLTTGNWKDLRVINRRHPRVHWLKRGAIKGGADTVTAAAAQILAGTEVTITTFFSTAPGEAPGQGEAEQEGYEGLALTQLALNQATGHEYARINAFQGDFAVTLVGGDDYGIEPALLSWITFSTPILLREFQLINERMLPKELSIVYNSSQEGLTKRIDLILEREVTGTPGVTYTPPISETIPGDDDTWPGDWTAPPPSLVLPPPPPDFYNPVKAYLLWDGSHVYYAPDILTGPTWEFADDGLSGNIYDCRYVINGASTVGIWLMASTGIWFCADIFTSPRPWVNVLPIATIQAADPVPAVGVVVCQAMANYASEPGYLCVATGPNATADSSNDEYAHTIFWHTHDYGSTWTQIDANYLTRTTSSKTRGFCRSNVQAMEIFRSSPGTIYCIRSTPNVVLNYGLEVLMSSDLGHTWGEAAFQLQGGANNRASYSILHPFPSATDACYAVSGPVGVSDQPDLHRSTNEWATGVQLTDNGTPINYGGICSVWRVNKISDDPNHVLGWFRYVGPTEGGLTNGDWHLLESNDQGATWSLLYDSGFGTGNVVNLPVPVTVNSSYFGTPNGWPPDPNIWFLVRVSNLGSASNDTPGAIMMTLDHFATPPVDLAGNLGTLLGSPIDTWTRGPCGGIALPKIGPNA